MPTFTTITTREWPTRDTAETTKESFSLNDSFILFYLIKSWLKGRIDEEWNTGNDEKQIKLKEKIKNCK